MMDCSVIGLVMIVGIFALVGMAMWLAYKSQFSE